jgi:hypothetical protein
MGSASNLPVLMTYKEAFFVVGTVYRYLGGYLAKVGILSNLSPHLRNSAILRTTILNAELQTIKSCGTPIADLQNLTSAIPQLSPVSCQSATF